MSARDPETGQFVSGGQAASYRDLDPQHYRGTFRDNDIGTNQAYSLADIASLEPAGGIDRTEEAELVALHIHQARAELDEATLGTAPDAVRAGFEISRDGDIGPLTQFRTEVDLSNQAFEGDAPTSALSRQIATEDPDVHWFTMLRADATGNGRTTPRHGPEHINFRLLAGEGPVYRRSDEMHIHGRVNAVELQDNWVADLMFTAYWHVRDRQ